MGSAPQYSVPEEAQSIFQQGILDNDLVPDLPSELRSLAKLVRFNGSSEPTLPINWRFAESISALKAFEASMLMILISRKYKTTPTEVTINTDHATLFIMSPLVAKVIKDGEPRRIAFDVNGDEFLKKAFPSTDKHRLGATPHRSLTTNIYKTKDGRFYHVHGSLNPEPSLEALGLPADAPDTETYEQTLANLQSAVSTFDSAALDELMNEKYRQAGTICYSSEEFFASAHGKANAHVALYELPPTSESSGAHPPSWWPENSSIPSSPKRPLAGLKIVDLTRIIAGPSITRGLAEMGASVMRITSPHVADFSVLHPDLNWGKWNGSLHLTNEEDKEKLRALIRDADVVVDGYRPGVMEKHGFGRDAIFELVKERDRGIIHVRENCYGWHGPWSHRSGWQQISDACTGVSMSYAKAMGNDEAVTPVFPNSDYCTGVCGSTAVLHALVRRAEFGGNQSVDVALNYYSQWLIRSVGTYPPETWTKVHQRYKSPIYRHYHNMGYTLPAMLKLLSEYNANTLFDPAFFENRAAKNIELTFVLPKPIAQFKDEDVKLGYNVGTRTNGVDVPRWPDDLNVEHVTDEN
ncbi:CoA-transferase family III [Pseudovirgaria hyperparasitica]|uniref:CoA-transferase family III n=1 Tax=Pseudovirgaria hyperparasitica TaxID=470096 RepID=A0A6A6VUY7_9PEZI|nr:CoA-transferase family III [Pseudovirgaria hyperparasitica]KAF2753061.1 CoA-transferase family III [Pseudovirgaria hyperparasitica]